MDLGLVLDLVLVLVLGLDLDQGLVLDSDGGLGVDLVMAQELDLDLVSGLVLALDSKNFLINKGQEACLSLPALWYLLYLNEYDN